MINLRDETIAAITKAGKSPGDISYIGDRNNSYSWPQFLRAANIKYDNGYGAANVSHGFVIVFTDGSWLERGEYDGAEWWEYKRCFTVPEGHVPDEQLVLFPSD